MSDSPSEQAGEAARWAAAVGSDQWTEDFRTPKVRIPRERWVEAHRTLKPHLPFFSWLSAVDWTAEVAVGDPPEAATLVPRFEVLSRLSDVASNRGVILCTDLPRDDARIDSVTAVYGGAEWHEREAGEMFGIEFLGHPHLAPLYLPDGFEGHPLLKSFPLLSREVKPWPGAVSVEPLPGERGAEEK